MIKDKGDKVGGNRNAIKEELPEGDAGHVSRAGAPGGGSSGGPGGPSSGLKEADEAPRVKLECGDDNDLPTADIKTEMDQLIDSEGDPAKSPSCDMVGPGSLKSERLSSDSNDVLDPQTGLRGPPVSMQESCQRNQSAGNVGDGMQCRAPEGVQPLPSNVISKQPNNMEYSQQQSQIFVFSTTLANKGADAVVQGNFQSIIAYHCAQPGTKKYLEKHPLKMTQFNKQNPAQWLNNLAMVKNRGAIRGSGGPNMPPNVMSGPNCGGNQMPPMMGGGHMGNMHMSPGMGQMGPNMGPMGPNMCQMGPARIAGPGQPNQMMMMKGNGGQMPNMGPGGMGPGMSPMDGFSGNNGPCSVLDGVGNEGDLPWDTKNPMHHNGIGNVGNGNVPGNVMGPGENIAPGGPPSVSSQDCSGNRGGGSPADLLKLPNLQGVKIPDENLTPQQRAHREEQLATIRKFQQMFFPESGMGPGRPNQGQMMDPNQNPNEQNPINNAGNMPPNSSAGGPGMNPNNVPMGFNQMGPLGPNCPMGLANMGQMNSPGMMGPNGPNCSMGPNGPMGHNNPMNSMGGNVQMGPNGPMGGGMQMGNMGPCMKGGMRTSACGGPDMKQPMCGDVHMTRSCSGPMNRMNSMAGMKPCMMDGSRIMPGANINTMNGGIMMDGGVMGDCGNVGGPSDPMGLGGPVCDDFARNRNMSGSGNNNDNHKLGLRSPRSPSTVDVEWQKIQHQFFDHEHKSNIDGDLGGQVKSPCSDRGSMSTGSCLPPPPYSASPLHRSASVPIATQSPSQCSNIQMPMSAEASRANSALNSPAECGTVRTSTGTIAGGPGSGQHKGLPKNPLDGGPEEGMFVRTLQCLAAQQQKQQSGPVKEANLMPVPSPQQIQYLNTFEGQELTIQKQPNTSIKEGSNTNQKSPGMMPGTPEGLGSNTPGNGNAPMLERSGRYSLDHSPGFPGSNNPQTPNSNITPNDKQRPSPSSNRSVQDPNSKPPLRDSMGPNTPQSLNQGPYAPNSNQSTNPSMTSPSHVMMSNSNNLNSNQNLSNPNNLNNNSNNLVNNPNTLSTPNSLNNPSSINNPNTMNNPAGVNPGPNNFNKGVPNAVPASTSVNSTNVNTSGSMTNVNTMSNNPAMGMGNKMPGGLDDSPTGMSGPVGNMPGGPENNGMGRGEHTPLVPGGGGGGGGGFDPISSLAQMSQQLTGGPPHPHAHPHSHHHAALLMQDMGCHMEGMNPGMNPMDNMMGPNDFPPEMNMSPKMAGGPMGPMGSMGPDPSMMGPRMTGKMPPFNGANIQVKASAPNTIQYLPTRPQLPCNAGPRGPPSLDFLQRVTNPMMDVPKNTGMNMQYFPGGPCGGPMGHSGSPGMGPRMDMSDQMGPMGPMRQQGPMMTQMRGGSGMLRMPHYSGGFNSPPKMGDPFSPGMGPNNPMMCNPNFRPAMMKGAPMRMGAPNPSQPLPASMGGPSSFKSSQNFVVPSTTDPNYAQQFHNFQQQLYATGTRSQTQPGPHYPGYMPK